jgi:hypothetical protein
MTPGDGRALTSRESNRLDQLRVLARIWDELIRLPVLGRSIGLDAVIGLIPGVGDVAAALVASWALVVAHRMGAPPSLLLRMAGIIGLDTLVGAIPLVGDLFDIGWRAQRRNVQLLERWLDTPHAVQRSSRAILVGVLAAVLVMVVAACWLAVVAIRWVF